MVTVIIIILVVVFVLWLILTHKKTCKKIVSEFSKANVIAFGKIGHGKDILFQKAINLRKKPYHGNMTYGGKFQKVDISEITVETKREKVDKNGVVSYVPANTYEDLIDGTVLTINKKFNDKEDFYISDGGIFLPSQYDTLLDKKYPCFPIAYALIRQLYLSHIHINTQYLGRVWKKIREQADSYILARGVIRLPFVLLCKVRFYERYDSAERMVSPYRMPLVANKVARAEKIKYDAENGLIENGFYFIRKKEIKYDTRYFHRVFFGEEAKKKF